MNETALTNKPPGDEAGRVLNTPIHRDKRPEVICLPIKNGKVRIFSTVFLRKVFFFTCGRIKRRMDMSMAGVADPTPTLLPRTVSTLTQTSGHSHTMYITQAKNPLQLSFLFFSSTLVFVIFEYSCYKCYSTIVFMSVLSV